VQLHDELASVAKPQAVDAADARLEERRRRDRRTELRAAQRVEGPGDIRRRCVAEHVAEHVRHETPLVAAGLDQRSRLPQVRFECRHPPNLAPA
jgi:hypothetical protein